MSKRVPDVQDDNHTIADMSSIRRQRLVLPDVRGLREHNRSVEPGLPPSTRDFSEELQSAEERWMVILGTLKAALAVGMVYIVVFAIVIAFLVLVWN